MQPCENFIPQAKHGHADNKNNPLLYPLRYGSQNLQSGVSTRKIWW